MIHFNNIAAIVTDIEGTTTPISFVHDILFPFVSSSENLEPFLAKNWNDDAFQKDIIQPLRTLVKFCI